MRKLLLSLLVVLSYAFTTNAQNSGTGPLISADGGDNLIKLNVTSLFLKSFALQYERKVFEQSSVGLGIRYMPTSSMPFKSTIADLIDDPSVKGHIDNFKTGNFALTPEYRMYLGSEAFKGFYVGFFGRYANFKAELPAFEYGDGTVAAGKIDLSGKLNAFTAGVQIGAQFRLSPEIYLDLMILGPQYGGASGNISGKSHKKLSKNEQDELFKELDNLKIPIVKKTVTVNEDGAEMKINGPWAGVRAGLTVGYRF